MKAYTDIPQSQNLLNILPIDTCDLCYNRLSKNDEFNIDILRLPIHMNTFSINEGYQLPCWSLVALLSLLPRPTLHQTNDGKWYCDITDNRTYFSKHYDNPVDACVEMVLKLKELNLSK